MQLKNELLDALIKEIRLQKKFGSSRTINTIYFGGGTPSILAIEDLNRILQAINENFTIDVNPEITIECNPDDLSNQYLYELKNSTLINRLSIGIQSFADEDLEPMNRAHSAKESHQAIINAQLVGFKNISADLIFGSHTTTQEIWKANLTQMIEYDIPHLSIYGLTVEPKTALANFIKTGKYPSLNDLKYQEQFLYTQQFLFDQGYQQYEISNYGKPNHSSKHNSAYWEGVEYLGIGPSSHSFFNGKRFWNINKNKKYIDSINSGIIPCEEELLTDNDKFNEFIMIGLRTSKGCSIKKLKTFDEKYAIHFHQITNELMETGKISSNSDAFTIPSNQRIFTDQITQELFFVD